MKYMFEDVCVLHSEVSLLDPSETVGARALCVGIQHFLCLHGIKVKLCN